MVVEEIIKIFCQLVSMGLGLWWSLSLFIVLRGKVPFPQFSLMDLLFQFLSYGMVMYILLFFMEERKFSVTTITWVLIAEALTLPVALIIGCNNRRDVHGKFERVRLIAFFSGLCYLTVIPSVIIGVAFIPELSPYRTHWKYPALWALLLIPLFSQFYFWLLRRAARSEKGEYSE